MMNVKKKQRILDVKRSALEKTCLDENVQLKWLYDLSAFLDCAYQKQWLKV